jgi:hypothetical protein
MLLLVEIAAMFRLGQCTAHRNMDRGKNETVKYIAISVLS